jgi:hypothetical protein
MMPATTKNITAFSFASPAATGVINGLEISVTVPMGTDVTVLVATFTHTGASVAVDGTAQTSGVTANDFTGSVTYTVTAADASTQEYVVTVTVSEVTSPQIAKVRRMVSEPATTTYSDAAIQTIIEAHALVDSEGYSPDQANWTATYDLNAAAADIWEEKAGGVFDHFDFTADGGHFTRSQKYEHAMKQARYYRSKRNYAAVELETVPKPDDDITDEQDEV